ncbi:hypothetical protein [Neisseria uirgultaei]|nr:hypothetical protein [Neisseria uirgultaei]
MPSERQNLHRYPKNAIKSPPVRGKCRLNAESGRQGFLPVIFV